MELILATVRTSGGSKSELIRFANQYIERVAHYMPAKAMLVRSVDVVFELRSKPASNLVLLDSRGKLNSSEDIAETLRKARDGGIRSLILAIGPADGWSDQDRQKADTMISLGKITLPHELAALVLAEQMYRACTILAGHPYHCGH